MVDVAVLRQGFADLAGDEDQFLQVGSQANTGQVARGSEQDRGARWQPAAACF